jgi:hypothetical protein
MSRSGCVATAVVLMLCVVVAEDAIAQGRSGGAPGWGGGGPPGTTFETPLGSPSDGLTSSHTTGPQGGGPPGWGGGGQPGTTFDTPSDPPSSGNTKSHTTGRQ